jgi:AraC-like DNA-binding protein
MTYSRAWPAWGLVELDTTPTDLSVCLPSYGCAVDVIRSRGMQRHRHPAWEMAWVHSGAVVVSIGDSYEVLTPGDLVVFDGTVIHGFCPIGASYTRTSVHFVPQLVPTPESSLSPRTPLAMSVTNGTAREVIESLLQLRAAFETGAAGTSLTEGIAKLLLELGRVATSPPRALLPPLVAEVLEFMIRHPERSVSLGDLSNQFHVSRGHLCRLFQEGLGHSPQSIWLRVKIQHGCHLLLNQVSISSASAATGFATRRGFERAFRRVTGLSPGEYKEARGHLS